MPYLRQWRYGAAPGRDRAVLSVGTAVQGQPRAGWSWTGRDKVGNCLLLVVGGGQNCCGQKSDGGDSQMSGPSCFRCTRRYP